MLLPSPILSAIILALACPRSVVVKASSTTRITNPATTTEVDSVICEVSLSELTKISPDGVQQGGHRYDCLTVSGNGPHEIHLHFAANSVVRRENEKALVEEGWFVSFPLDWVKDDAHLLPHETEQVTTLTLAEVDEALALLQERHGGRSLQHGSLRKRTTASVVARSTHHRRRELGAVGARNCGIVIVHAEDTWNPETVASVDHVVYTTASNQFRACSNNAVSLNRKDATISVTLPRALSSYNAYTVYDAARMAVCTYYRQPSNCEPATIRGLDHILYSLPFGTSDDVENNFWAYASIGGAKKSSIYNGYYFIPSTIIHELGHNMFLGHAIEGNDEYGDKTGHMGSGGTDKRCFNGYNMFVLGWLPSQTKVIDSLNPGAIERYTLKSIADMGTGGFVNIKIGPLYLVYNMNKGINAATLEHQGEILVHQGQDISFGTATHFDTRLPGTLTKVGARLEVNNFQGNNKAIVEVCSMDKVGSNGVTIVVGLNRASCVSGFAIQSTTATTSHNVATTTGNPVPHVVTEARYTPTTKNLVLHAADGTESLPAIVDSSMERLVPIQQQLKLEPETEDMSPIVLQLDASLSSVSTSDTSSMSATNLLLSSFDIKCDNMWKDTVAIQGFVGEQTCEWVLETQGGAYCDSAMNSDDFVQQPVKAKCQVQCLEECSYAAVCRRSGDRCSNASSSSSSIGQCCEGASCVDGICR